MCILKVQNTMFNLLYPIHLSVAYFIDINLENIFGYVLIYYDIDQLSLIGSK